LGLHIGTCLAICQGTLTRRQRKWPFWSSCQAATCHSRRRTKQFGEGGHDYSAECSNQNISKCTKN